MPPTDRFIKGVGMKFNDLRVAHKLWSVILGLLLLMLLAAVWTQARSSRATAETEARLSAYEEAITTAVRWRGLAEVALTMSIGSAGTSDPELKKDFDAKVAALTARITPVQEKITKTAESALDKEALDAVAKTRADVRAVGGKIKGLREAGDMAALQAFVESDYRPRAAAYLDSIDKYVAAQEKQRDDAKAALKEVRKSLQIVAVSSAVVVFALSIFFSMMLVRSITQPLEQAVDLAKAIMQGDLTREMSDDRKDEFGVLMRALTDMVTKLRGLVSEVRSGVESMSTASSEIANGNHDLSARTEQTASNLQQTAASMEELTSTVNQSADTAREANSLAANAARVASQGGEVVGQVILSMQHITDSSRKIGDIISVIDGIAFQTNILALNAAVEAARAGEQGRGFAVVASEVRSLAGRSAEAAKEIKSLINTSVERVEHGTALVDKAGVTMTEVVSSIRRVTDIMGEISAASNEQSLGVAQVGEAVTQMDQATQQNAALVEEMAAAASSLKSQANELVQVVGVFKL